MIGEALDHGGGLDVLVNNAGNMYRGALSELDETQLTDVFNSNVIAAMMMSQLALPHLVERSGAIVFIGSVHSQRAFPGASPYAATKGAIETLTGVLAAELGTQGVRVSVRAARRRIHRDQRSARGSSTTRRRERDSNRSRRPHALGRVGRSKRSPKRSSTWLGAEWTTGNVLTVDGGLGLGVTNA